MQNKKILILIFIAFAFLLIAPSFVFAVEPITCCVTKDSQQKITRCTAAYSATTDCSFFGGGNLQNQSCGTIDGCIQLQNATQFCCVGQVNQTVANCIPAYSASATCDYDAGSGMIYTLNNQACGSIDSCKQLLGSTPAQPSAPSPAPKETPFVPLEPKLQIPIPDLTFSKIMRQGQLIGIPYLADYIAGVYKYAVGIVSFVAIIVIMIGGLRWLTAGGNASAIGSAKEMISGAVIGLFIALGSYLVLYTINPDLVSFKNLQVKLVARQELDEGPGADLGTAPSVSGSKNCDQYDDLFKKYAPCLGADYKALKAIASAESGCVSNPNGNGQGYYGFGQTKPSVCKGILPDQYCTTDELLKPEVGIAFIANFQKANVQIIKQYCANATAAQQGAALEVYHNIPSAGKAFIIAGCANDQAFIDTFMKSYNTSNQPVCWKMCSAPYINKYAGGQKPSTREEYTNFLLTVAKAKLNFAKNTAGPIFSALGGNVANSTVSGSCPSLP